MLRIYHVKGTRSMRVIWLCEEIGHPYQIVTVDFSPEYRQSDEWRAISPTGKVPAMTDGDLTMFESGAMVQYVLLRYGNGRLEPEVGTEAHAHCLQWCWFAEATLARPLGEMVHHKWFKPEAERLEAVVLDNEKKARTCLAALDKAVEDQQFLLGDEFSVADIMTGYSLNLAERLEVLDDHYPALLHYFSELKERAGFQKAIQ